MLCFTDDLVWSSPEAEVMVVTHGCALQPEDQTLQTVGREGPRSPLSLLLALANHLLGDATSGLPSSLVGSSC